MNADDIDPSKITSWADLWNPEFKGKVLLTSDAREVFHIALILDGKSPNTTNEEDIKAAYERLVKLLPNVVTFNSDSPEVPFCSKVKPLSGCYGMVRLYLAHKENPSIQFVYPKEGAIFWMDNYAIPKVRKIQRALINLSTSLLRPENAKLVVEKMGFSMPNEGVKALLSPEMANNPTLFPSAENIEKALCKAMWVKQWIFTKILE